MSKIARVLLVVIAELCVGQHERCSGGPANDAHRDNRRKAGSAA